MAVSQLQTLLSEIAEKGKNTDGSYTRTCYSDTYFEAARAVLAEMEALGMETGMDRAGNVRGYLGGNVPGAKKIMIGSHLDTVPCGGKFDGAYGVCAALAAVRLIKENKMSLNRPVEIWGFNGEESNPLGGTFGSRAVAGLISSEQAGLRENLGKYGRSVEEIMGCERSFEDTACFLELHIEQGDYLYNSGTQIGIVSGIVGIVRYEITAEGQSNHSGTTMMKNRRDALVGMARLIVSADEAARQIDDTLVLTVGTAEVFPGAQNVIPGKVKCCFEMRHMDSAKTDLLIQKIGEIAEAISGIHFSIEKKIDKGAVTCDESLIRLMEEVCKAEKVSCTVMASGAGHDANALAHRTPVGMIFVPSINGISHDRRERTEDRDLENGLRILYNTVLALDALPEA